MLHGRVTDNITADVHLIQSTESDYIYSSDISIGNLDKHYKQIVDSGVKQRINLLLAIDKTHGLRHYDGSTFNVTFGNL